MRALRGQGDATSCKVIRAGKLLSSALLAGTLMVAPASAAPADRPLIIDAHADVPNPLEHADRTATIDAGSEVDIDKLRAGGVGAVFLSVHAPKAPRTPEGHKVERAIADAKLAAIKEIAARHPDKAALATSADDIRRIAESGRTAIVLSVLGASAFETDPDAVQKLYDAGVRVLGFVHAGNNGLADSSRPFAHDTPGENGGLSALGRQWVGDANRAGVVLDVSQLSTAALLQTTSLTRAPVLATHSGVRALVDNARNLTDEELKAVAKTGGATCIVAFSSYLMNPTPAQQAALQATLDRYGGLKNGYEGLTTERRLALYAELKTVVPKASLDQYVDSIDHAVKVAGIEHVCLSTDFNHGNTGLDGWQDESETGNVTQVLRRRGYSEADIALIWSGNVLRVMAAAASFSRSARTR